METGKQHRNNRDPRKSRVTGAFAVAIAALVLLLPATPAGAVKREFFGVVPVGTPEPQEFDAMDAGKVGTYRFQLSWASIQPTEGGPYDWSVPDERVEQAASHGMQPLPFIYGTPGYAAPDPREPPLGSAAAKEQWRQFLRAAAQRYGPGGEFWQTFQALHPDMTPRPVRVWQILNEQNSPTFFKPKPSPKRYAELLKISDKALKRVDAGADILLGGMFGTPGRDKGIFSWKFLKRLYKRKGAKKHFDAVALHPYSPDRAGVKEQIRRAREQIRKRGKRKTPIWITELGWGSAGTKGHQLIKSRKGQKKMLRQSFRLILDNKGKWKVRRLLWFAWRDPSDATDAAGTVCTWCASAGLLDKDLDPKPSWNEFRSFTGAR